MKTYQTVQGFENALKSGALQIEQVLGPHGQHFYFLGLLVNTNERIIRVKVA